MKVSLNPVVKFLMFTALMHVNVAMAACISAEQDKVDINKTSTIFNNKFNGLVDDFSNKQNTVATIFIRKGDDFVRVSSSVRKEDGSRAIGSNLEHANPAYGKAIQGNEYVGELELFGTKYMTKYTPIKDENGNVLGLLFVGEKI